MKNFPKNRILFLIGLMILITSWDNTWAAQNRPARGDSDKPARSAQLFDKHKYIDLDEIETGMQGYGLTVFKGIKIEKFAVEVVSVIRNSPYRGAKRGAIIIRCRDKRFDLPKSIQGVSGSPVYFDGRLAGAMSFGWQYIEEPLYGVTPIREMLTVRQSGLLNKTHRFTRNAARFTFEQELYRNLIRRDLLAPADITRLLRRGHFLKTSTIEQDNTGMFALPAAISMSGLTGAGISELQRWIPDLNVREGLAGNNIVQAYSGKIHLQPGASLTIPLITGDMQMAVLGTVTEVIGGQVFAFGHSWQGEGPVTWPMGTGYIHTVVSLVPASFKLGQAVEVVGAIQGDESSGVYGQLAAVAPMIPMQMRVSWPELGSDEQFAVKLAQDETSDPLLATEAAIAALMYRGGLPREHTIQYQIRMQFDNLPTIAFTNLSSMSQTGDIIQDVLPPLGLLLNNPWKKVQLTKMDFRATVTEKSSLYEITAGQLSATVFIPGQTVTATLKLEGIHCQPKTQTVSLTLPKDIKPGKYKIKVGDYSSYQMQLRMSSPHRFAAFSSEDVQRVLQERLSIPRNRIYMTLIMPGRGVAIEGRELPELPGSKRFMLTDKSRQLIATSFRPMLIGTQDTDYVVDGNRTFDIEVRKE